MSIRKVDSDYQPTGEPLPLPDGVKIQGAELYNDPALDGLVLIQNGTPFQLASVDTFQQFATQFDQLEVVDVTSQLEISSNTPLSYAHYIPETAGTASVNTLSTGDRQALYELTVGGSTGDKATLKSLFQFKYAASYEMLWGMPLQASEALPAGITVRAGYFDDTTGVFLEFTSSSRRLVFRKGGEDYAQADFSEGQYNPFNRSGENYNHTFGGVWRASGSLYGFGDWSVKGLLTEPTDDFGTQAIGREFREALQAGVKGEPSVDYYNNRLRVELENTGGGAGTSIYTGEFEANLKGRYTANTRTPDVEHWAIANTDIDDADNGDPTGFAAVRHEPGFETVITSLSKFGLRSDKAAKFYTRRVPSTAVTGLTDSDFGTPRYKNADEVAVEEAITSFTVDTDANGDMLGEGGPTVDLSGGAGRGNTTAGGTVFEKFRLPRGWYLVFLGETAPGSTTSDPIQSFSYELEEAP